MRRALLLTGLTLALVAGVVFSSPAWGSRPSGPGAGSGSTARSSTTPSTGVRTIGADAGVEIRLTEFESMNLGLHSVKADSAGFGILTTGSVDTSEVVADAANVTDLSAARIGATRIVTSELVAHKISTSGGLALSYGDSRAFPGDATLNTLSGRSTIRALEQGTTITNALVTPKAIISCGLETVGVGTSTVLCVPAKNGGAFHATAVNPVGDEMQVPADARFWWIIHQ